MRIVLPFLLASLSLGAGTLDDLRAALSRLPGQSPVKGNMEVQTWSRNGSGKDQDVDQGQASLWVEDGPAGLKLMWNRALLQQAEKEAKAEKSDPKAKKPVSTALGKIRPLTVAEAVNVAPDLLRSLEGAKVLEERAEAWQGHPARLLVIEPVVPMSESERKAIKDLKAVAKVWVGEDGLPLAEEHSVHLKFSKFLISFQNDQQEQRSFAKMGDRLVILRREESSQGSGMGMSGQSRTVTTFKAE